MSHDLELILVTVLLTGLLAVVGFFSTRIFSKKDAVEDKLESRLQTDLIKIDSRLETMQNELRFIRDEVTNTKSMVKAAWKGIEDLRTDFRDLRQRQDTMRDQLR